MPAQVGGLVRDVLFLLWANISMRKSSDSLPWDSW